MNWNKGFSASYYMTEVDPTTWRDLQRIDITSGSLSKERSNLMQSADIVCRNYPQKKERWVRIWLDARQGETVEHEALFTGLAVSPSRKINGLIEEHQVECYSVLKLAEDVLLERGWYAPEGVKGSTLVKQLLNVTPAPIIEYEYCPSLANSIIAEENETRLSMAEKILQAVNWRLRISGDGVITICPNAQASRVVFDTLEMDIIEPEIEANSDWYDCPNVFRAVEDDLIGIARDDNEDSPLSTVSRGREIWAQETNCDLNDGETVGEYAIRKLKELQSSEMTVSYNRRFVPDVLPSDIVQLRLPAQGIDSEFIIDSQSIELNYGARVSEELSKA